MTGLIKSDFKKFFQDKLFLIVCILAVVFAAITPLLYAVIMWAMGDSIDPITSEMLAGYVTAKGQFFSAFSFGNNLGLIAPLLIGIIFYKDFSYGTVRNKIISGHSRTSIFLSIVVVCTVTLFGIVLAHALLTLGISLPFFEYQSTPFEWADFWYLLESLGFMLLVYIFVATFVSWLCVTAKNMGIVIVLYIAVVFGLSMVAGILQSVVIVLEMEPNMEKWLKVLEFIQRINVFYSSSTIGIGTSYAGEDVWYYVLPPTVSTVAMLGHGIWAFNRKDLK